MYCTNCGVDLVAGSAFCPSCGKPTLIPTPTASAQSSFEGMQPNLAGAFCYLAGFITGMVFLILDPYKNDHFVRFHAFQSIFLSVAWFGIYFGLEIFLNILQGMFWRIGLVLNSVVGLGLLLLWVFLIFKAYNNEKFKLPLIGYLVTKQA